MASSASAGAHGARSLNMAEPALILAMGLVDRWRCPRAFDESVLADGVVSVVSSAGFHGEGTSSKIQSMQSWSKRLSLVEMSVPLERVCCRRSFPLWWVGV